VVGCCAWVCAQWEAIERCVHEIVVKVDHDYVLTLSDLKGLLEAKEKLEEYAKELKVGGNLCSSPPQHTHLCRASIASSNPQYNLPQQHLTEAVGEPPRPDRAPLVFTRARPACPCTPPAPPAPGGPPRQPSRRHRIQSQGIRGTHCPCRPPSCPHGGPRQARAARHCAHAPSRARGEAGGSRPPRCAHGHAQQEGRGRGGGSCRYALEDGRTKGLKPPPRAFSSHGSSERLTD
jgi:hypothetical protein